MTGKRRATPGSPHPSRPPQRSTDAPDARPAGGGLGSRRRQRLQQRERRRRLGRVGIAAVVVAVLAVAAGVALTVRSVTSTPARTGRTQTTLLFQLAGPDGTSQGAMLLAHDPAAPAASRGVEVLVPSTVITSVCGAGDEPFGSILGLPGGDSQASTTLSGMLGGVTVDGTWTLDDTQLASLVDKVGGITVDVDTNVTRSGAHGRAVVEVQRGSSQHLTGRQAVAYASFRRSRGEDAAAQLARFQSVVQATIDRLPPGAATARLLGGLGSGAGSTLGASRLASLLQGLAADDRQGGGVLPVDLPLTRLDTGGSPSYDVDRTAAQQLAVKDLAASLPAATTHRLTVDVSNGVGTPGLVPAACAQLTRAGLDPQNGGNSEFGHGKTRILVKSRTVAGAEQGKRVADALGLPQTDVEVDPVGDTLADVVVVLGRDYKP